MPSKLLVFMLVLFPSFCAWSQNRQAIPRVPQSIPTLRTEGGLAFLQLSPNRQFLAFSNELGQSLRIMDLRTQEIIEVSPDRTAGGFFWSPDGYRLFYRQLVLDAKAKISSELMAFDCKTGQSVPLASLEGSSGFPVFNPYDQSLLLLHEKGILRKRLHFPGERLARWQKRKREEEGQWVVTQGAVIWLSTFGLEMRRLEDDRSGLRSYALSPDGLRIAWATKAGRLYAATLGGEVQSIGEGRDPTWHPEKTFLLYAAPRRIGQKVYDTDLKISDLKGNVRSLSLTQDIKERWPQWLDNETILYTADKTTDLFRMHLSLPAPTLAKASSYERSQ